MQEDIFVRTGLQKSSKTFVVQIIITGNVFFRLIIKKMIRGMKSYGT
jgi:hypothetical protein